MPGVLPNGYDGMNEKLYINFLKPRDIVGDLGGWGKAFKNMSDATKGPVFWDYTTLFEDIEDEPKGKMPVKVKLTLDSYQEGRLATPEQCRFTTAFVYPKKAYPFVVQGPEVSVVRWLRDEKEKKEYAAFVHVVIKHEVKVGERVIDGTICYHRAIGLRDDVFVSVLNCDKSVADIRVANEMEVLFCKRVRKVPRSWIKELDDYLDDKVSMSYIRKPKYLSPEAEKIYAAAIEAEEGFDVLD